MTSKINKLEFYRKVNHATLEYLVRLSKIMEDLCLVSINPNQDRFELINTLEALYYKDKDKCHSNSFLESNHLNRFEFNIHFNCPFSEYSNYKLPYSIIADTFGYNVPFSRKDAEKRVREVLAILNISSSFGEESIIYRLVQQLQVLAKKNLGVFGESLGKTSGKIILYDIERWENGIPIFKKKTNLE